MHKMCTKCKELKLLTNFSKKKTNKDGLQYFCKQCNEEYAKNYRKLNTEKAAEYHKLYREEYDIINKDRIAERKRKYRQENKERLGNYKKVYRENNRDKINANTAKRRASKLSATPKWLTQDDFLQIEYFYKEAIRLKLLTNQEYHVDHIVPLQGENVCGLHVPWNLQVILAKENLSKHNKLQEDIL